MLDRILGSDEPHSTPAYGYYDPEKKTKPYKSLDVAPELLRAYEDNEHEDIKPSQYYQDNVKNGNKICTTIRVSPDTILKRCRARE